MTLARRPLLRMVGVLVVLGLVGGGFAAWRLDDRPRAAALQVTVPRPVVHPAVAAPARDAGAPPNAAAVVAKTPSLVVYARPGGDAPVQTTLANPTEYGQTLVLLALDVDSAPGWYQVSSPVRPNGTTGWVLASAVTLTQVPYQITIVQHLHQATLWNDGKKVRSYPVAIGRPATPSPNGLFFVNAIIDNRQGNQAYGPWVLGMTGYSEAYTTFNGGDALVAMHGTDEDSTVGTTASHGCFRMHSADATALAHTVTLGTPVYVSP